MDIASLGLEVRSDGVVIASDRLKKFGQDAAYAERAGNSLSGMFKMMAPLVGALGAAFSVRAVKQYADAWSDASSRIGIAVGDMEAAPTVMAEMERLARASYSSLGQTVEAFARNSTALRDLGYSTQGALDFTESLNHALVITATRGERAASVQNALAKAMAVGKLQAEGLETVLANGGRVAEALAAELGTNVSGLRAMATQGRITGDVIARALITRVAELRKQAGEMPATMEDAGTIWDMTINALIGRMDKALGVSGSLAESMIGLADKVRAGTDDIVRAAVVIQMGLTAAMDFASNAASVLGEQFDAASWLIVAGAGTAGFAVAALTAAIAGGLISAVSALTATLLANPFALFIGAVAAAGTATYLFGDGIDEAIAAVGRIVTYGATAVTMFGTYYVGALAAAYLSTMTLAGGLAFLRGALMRTGIGVLVIAAGELVYQFMRLVEASGGFGNTMALLGDVGSEVWERIKNGGNSLVASLEAVFNDIAAGWMSMVEVIQGAWADFLHAAALEIKDIPGMGSAFSAVHGAAVKAGSAVYDTRSEIEKTREEAERLRKVSSDLWADANAPLKSVEALRDVLKDANAPGTSLFNGMSSGIADAWEKAGDAAAKFKDIANDNNKAMPTFDPDAAKKAEKLAKAYARIVDGGQQFIAEQELERQAIGMTEQAANALRYEMDLLNEARRAGIQLTDADKHGFKALAEAMAEAEAETTALQRAFDFARDVVGGFVSDLRSGLENGEGFWKSFGNAAMNVLDKITDKLLNDVLDALFQVNSAGSGIGGGGGGFLGSLIGGIGSLFGFASGGYTGDGPVNAVAGAVHGQEYVFNAKATARIGRSNLDAIHEAANSGGGYVQSGVARMQAPANSNVSQDVDVTGGFSGFLGGLPGGSSFFPSAPAVGGAAPTSGMGLWAYGGAFEHGINGFSNAIVDRATPFRFANGAGIMGEAGPEAIMPLRRGPDGKLGVMAASTNQPQAVNQNATFNMHVKVSGNGDKELMERMRRGAQEQMQQALEHYRRFGVKDDIRSFQDDPRRYG